MPNNQNTSFHSGHRDRLRQKFVTDKITDYEFLELLLAYAIPRRDVREPSRALSKRFGCTARVINAPIEELIKIPGIAQNTAIFLKLIHHATLLDYKIQLQDKPIFHDANIIKNYCRNLLDQKSREEFHVLYLDQKFHLLESDRMAVGYEASAPVDHIELTRRASELRAKNVILVHNHPTGEMLFSKEDCETTELLEYRLLLVGAKLYDHILVAGGQVYSYKGTFSMLDKEPQDTTRNKTKRGRSK